MSSLSTDPKTSSSANQHLGNGPASAPVSDPAFLRDSRTVLNIANAALADVYVPPGALKLAAEAAMPAVLVLSHLDATACDAAGLPSISMPEALQWVIDLDTDSPKPRDLPQELLQIAKITGAVVIVPTIEERRLHLVHLTTLVHAIRAAGFHATCFACPAPNKLVETNDIQSWLSDMPAETVKEAIKQAAADALPGRVHLGGFEPLGEGGDFFYVWSNGRRTVIPIQDTALASWGRVTAAVGYEWAMSQPDFVKVDKQGFKSIDLQKLSGTISEACTKRGKYDPTKTRGAGVWYDVGTDDVIVNSQKCFNPATGHTVSRLTEYAYLETKDFGITPDTIPATAREARKAFDMLKSFNFEKKTDALKIFGWLMASYLAASLKERPHVFVQADAGAGKSYFMLALECLLGDACIRGSGGTAAGLSQKMQKTSCTYLGDESGVDSEHVGKKLMVLRQGFDGVTETKGSANHQAIDFDLRMMGILVGVRAPAMDPQDLSRFLLPHLNKIADGTPLHPLLPIKNTANLETKAMGQKLFARALITQPRFVKADAIVREAMGTGAEGRANDTLAPVIAAAFVALHDHDFSGIEEAKAWVHSFDIEEDVKRIRSVSSGQALMDILFSTVVSTDVRGRHDMTIALLCQRAAASGPEGKAWSGELGKHGLRLDAGRGEREGGLELRIHAGSPGFTKLFKDVKAVAGADLSALIKRVPGAAKDVETGRIGGALCSYRAVPYLASDEELPPLSDIGGRSD